MHRSDTPSFASFTAPGEVPTLAICWRGEMFDRTLKDIEALPVTLARLEVLEEMAAALRKKWLWDEAEAWKDHAKKEAKARRKEALLAKLTGAKAS